MLFGFPVIGYLCHLTTFERKLRTIPRILASNKPDLLVLGGDIVGHDMALYIKAGRELAVPSVLLPG
jgi:predicted MPP superfamily phosphohydrolase